MNNFSSNDGEVAGSEGTSPHNNTFDDRRNGDQESKVNDPKGR